MLKKKVTVAEGMETSMDAKFTRDGRGEWEIHCLLISAYVGTALDELDALDALNALDVCQGQYHQGMYPNPRCTLLE